MAQPLERETLAPRTFVVGDIHGCSAELSVLLSYLQHDEGLTPADLVLFVGDVIDRGPESSTVVQTLIDFAKSGSAETIFLRGNHEDMLLDYIGDEGRGGEMYLRNGGKETLQSYGLGLEAMRDPDLVKAALPAAHLAFFLTMADYFICEQFVVVHAGLHPLRGLREQIGEDLFWIRNEFVHNIHRFDKTIVYGHTPFPEVHLQLPYKVGVDTGLVYGRKLTCLELQSGKVLQVQRGKQKVVASKVELRR